jgi:hypothetical protein
MKNQTLKVFALAVIMFSGLGLTVSGTASGSPMPQRPQMPRPVFPPAPRPMPQAAPRPAPQPRQEAPRRESQPAPQQDQARQRQQQQAEQQRQQQQAQQRQAQQQQEQRQQADHQAEQQRQAQLEQQARQQKQQGEQRQQAQKQQENALQQKQQAEQQKRQAEQQKQAQKQQQKLQEKQNKEQAQRQKELQKQQEKQRKEQERQQKQGKGSIGRSSSETTTKSASASATHSKGALAMKSTGGRQIGMRANGSVASFSEHGKTATFDRHGKVSSIHTASMDIHRGQHGERRIVSRNGNTTVVTTGRHSGYVERRFVANNRTYTQRTVVLNGRVYTHTYTSYVVGGVVLHHFVTPVFFAPGFYGWAFYPWGVPVVYRWGWFGAPWYAGPNPYFVAYANYPGAAFWLTDYYLGQTLSAAAQEDADALPDGDGADMSADASLDSEDSDATQTLRADGNTPITPEIKAALTEEVKQQIAYDNAAASDGSADAIHGELPAALRSVGYVFVVSDSLEVTTSNQQSCGLQAGDILRLAVTPTDGTGIAELRVASSKKTDCPAGVQVTVSLPDLQDMQNNFHEQIEQGLSVLQATQGQNGLLAAPSDAVQIPPRPSPTGDASAAGSISGNEALALLDQQMQEANALEANVTAAASQPKN